MHWGKGRTGGWSERWKKTAAAGTMKDKGREGGREGTDERAKKKSKGRQKERGELWAEVRGREIEVDQHGRQLAGGRRGQAQGAVTLSSVRVLQMQEPKVDLNSTLFKFTLIRLSLLCLWLHTLTLTSTFDLQHLFSSPASLIYEVETLLPSNFYIYNTIYIYTYIYSIIYFKGVLLFSINCSENV